MSKPSLRVLHADDDLLVVWKPANLPTMGVVNRPTLLASAEAFIAGDVRCADNKYLHVINRLDAPVTGVVVLARSPEAARNLTGQMRAGTVSKRYWALLDEPLERSEDLCVNWLSNDKRHRKVHVTNSADAHAKEARLAYSTMAQLGQATLVEINLLTGRKHQIRVQLAHRGCPIIGDRKYGSSTPFSMGIALHARQLELLDPIRSQPLCFTAPLPPYWYEWGDWDPQTFEL